MKTLLIMRHGHSHRAAESPEDGDRTLSERGRQDAARMGQLLLEEDLLPERWLCSTARRARQTAVALANACGYEGEIDYRPELYTGGPEQYLAILHALGEDTARVLVVGHNPAVGELVSALAGIEKQLPTAALAHLRLPLDTWAELSPLLPGGLANLWRPRDFASLRLSP